MYCLVVYDTEMSRKSKNIYLSLAKSKSYQYGDGKWDTRFSKEGLGFYT